MVSITSVNRKALKEVVQIERFLQAEPDGTRKLLAKEKIVASKRPFFGERATGVLPGRLLH